MSEWAPYPITHVWIEKRQRGWWVVQSDFHDDGEWDDEDEAFGPFKTKKEALAFCPDAEDDDAE